MFILQSAVPSLDKPLMRPRLPRPLEWLNRSLFYTMKQMVSHYCDTQEGRYHMTSSVAAVTDTSPYILLEEVEAGIRKNYETVNKCAFETGRLYVEGRELCKEIGKDFDEWIDENTPYRRGHAYRLINVFERFKEPRYIHLVPQIQDSGQMRLARPTLKYANEILDYIVENIATEIDPKKKRLTHDRVQEIIYREQARIHAEREGAKPPPTQEDEECGILPWPC